MAWLPTVAPERTYSHAGLRAPALHAPLGAVALAALVSLHAGRATAADGAAAPRRAHRHACRSIHTPALSPSKSPSTWNGAAWTPAPPRCSSRGRARPNTRYRSSNTARGLFRLAIPDTITQVSHLSMVDGKVRPSSYSGDDGSSSTEKDVNLKFDWTAMRVTGIAEDKPVDAALTPGVQDSLSVQVALMCALAAGESPKSFQLIDKDEVKEYQYTHERNEALDTPVGKLDTVVYTSQRKGAKRLTRLWIAPEPGLPAGARRAGEQGQARAAVTS